MINVLVNGCNGNMGKVLIESISKTPDMLVKYNIDKNTTISFDNLLNNQPKPDVIIDFSTPEASSLALDYAVCNLIPIVIATTGFTDIENKKILEYAEAIPIFKSSNMSYTINLICKILSNISPLLSNMDIEILEKHHNKKKDSPSGTALLLADAINLNLENKYSYTYDRHNKKQSRSSNEIGFSSIRGGNLIGEHTVLFLGEHESIEIKHTAYSRKLYAEGAIRAARFIINQKKRIIYYGKFNFLIIYKKLIMIFFIMISFLYNFHITIHLKSLQIVLYLNFLLLYFPVVVVFLVAFFLLLCFLQFLH